jgi:hypothetical protein
MKPRNVWYSLLIVVALLALAINALRHEYRPKESFDRHPGHLVYSKHARCRMDCRQISEADVQEIMEKGIINFNKSDRYDRPCPTFALQGKTSDGEQLRIVFAQCSSETKVVTCINLKKESECHCPGDENKYKR